jgi:hypothetical protein
MRLPNTQVPLFPYEPLNRAFVYFLVNSLTCQLVNFTHYSRIHLYQLYHPYQPYQLVPYVFPC